MFSSNKDYSNVDTKDMIIELLKEVDEVKRYVANIHVNTDNEVNEMMTIMKKMERQLSETDRQIDRMERYERTLNEIKSSIKQLEKKVK